MPHSWAIAGKCSILFVLQPNAISIVKAFLKASSVIMSRGFMSFSSSSIIFMPARLASCILSEYTAGIVPLPRSAMPRTSVKQFMELAVYIPEHEPQLGHTLFSYSFSSSSVILPELYFPTASNILERLVLQPCTRPANIGPPLTNIVGIFSLAAAISKPGTFLSQLGIITRASKACANAIHSVESAIKSRVTREYFMP